MGARAARPSMALSIISNMYILKFGWPPAGGGHPGGRADTPAGGGQGGAMLRVGINAYAMGEGRRKGGCGGSPNVEAGKTYQKHYIITLPTAEHKHTTAEVLLHLVMGVRDSKGEAGEP
jgi:hypothetical protein